MSIHDIIAAYLTLLLNQLQADITVVTNPWVVCTILPLALYTAYFLVKWFVLLVPITMPLLLWRVRNVTVTTRKG
jgi:hypothetical protein